MKKIICVYLFIACLIQKLEHKRIFFKKFLIRISRNLLLPKLFKLFKLFKLLSFNSFYKCYFVFTFTIFNAFSIMSNILTLILDSHQSFFSYWHAILTIL